MEHRETSSSCELFLEPAAGMTQDQIDLLGEEDALRSLFAEERFIFTSEVHYNRYLACESVWDNIDKFHYAEETKEEKSVPKILTDYWKPLEGCAVVGREEFMERWDKFTLGMFEGIDWNNIYAAGGAVLACLCNPDMDDTFKGSDIDLFIWGIYDTETANNKLRHIHSVIMKNTGSRGEVVRTKRAVTILNQYPYRHVQVILRLYKNPGEVLLGFDIDSCGVGFDGKDVYAETRFRRALTKGYNLVNKSRRSVTYETRLFKYSKRGFRVAVPDLDKRRVNPKIFEQHLSDSEGLAKLLILEHSMIHPQSPFVKSRNTNNMMAMNILNQQVNRNKQGTDNVPEGRLAEIEALQMQHPSDYSDLYIPWGPTWYTNNIVRMLRYREKVQQAKQIRKMKQNKFPSKVKHYHRFVFGIDGVISGTSAWCIICKERYVAKKDKDKEPKASKHFSGPIEWMVDVPAYQDYDNGFSRNLLSGSFEPVNTNFEEGAYVEDSEMTPGHQSLIKYLLGRPKYSEEKIEEKKEEEITQNQQESIKNQFICVNCNRNFISLNRLRKHKRLGCEKDKIGNLPEIKISENVSPPILLGQIEPQEEQYYYQDDLTQVNLLLQRTNEPKLPRPSYEIDEDFIPTWALSIDNNFENSPFLYGVVAPTPIPTQSPITKNILLLSHLYKEELITLEERRTIKELVLKEDEMIQSCFDAFEIDNDKEELVDSLRTFLDIQFN